MGVSAIIVNYYTATYLPDLLLDLSTLDEMDAFFVVDNSGELDREMLCQKLPVGKQNAVILITPERNIGFGAGINRAAKQAVSDYLLVMNPDVRLFPECLEHLLNAARQYGAVLTGPRFYWDAEKKFRLPPSQGASAWMDYALKSAVGHRLEQEHLDFYWQMRHERFWRGTSPFPELFLSGACVLIDRQWGMAHGAALFDERFFLYYEDNDISLRAAFDGRLPLCVPAAEALHHYDQSPSPETSKGDLMGISHGIFSEKYYGDLSLPAMDMPWDGPQWNDLGALSTPPQFTLSAELLWSIAPSLYRAGAGEDKISCGNDGHVSTLPDTTNHESLGSRKHKKDLYINAHGLTDTANHESFDISLTDSNFQINGNRFYFEIGVTPQFIPFAQTDFMMGGGGLDPLEEHLVEDPMGERKSFSYQFSEEIWNKMANGIYYGRVRDAITGTVMRWRWEKVSGK